MNVQWQGPAAAERCAADSQIKGGITIKESAVQHRTEMRFARRTGVSRIGGGSQAGLCRCNSLRVTLPLAKRVRLSTVEEIQHCGILKLLRESPLMTEMNKEMKTILKLILRTRPLGVRTILGSGVHSAATGRHLTNGSHNEYEGGSTIVQVGSSGSIPQASGMCAY